MRDHETKLATKAISMACNAGMERRLMQHAISVLHAEQYTICWQTGWKTARHAPLSAACSISVVMPFNFYHHLRTCCKNAAKWLLD